MGKVLKFKHDSKAPNVKKSGRKSVLIVDDEYLNILMLSQILESEYIVYAEKDGKGALETAIEMKPDIILLDILMPEMDGFEVIAKLKNSIETRLGPWRGGLYNQAVFIGCGKA
jgi:CheY-like chemotaxis protein